MQTEEIIQKTLEIYSSDKNHVAKYLKHYIDDDSSYKHLFRIFSDRLNIPILATGGISEANLQFLRSNFDLDEDTMFDSSDYYQFVLNEDISQVDNWDFPDRIRSGRLIRLCRLFVNNCIPVYHLHVRLIGNNLDKYPPNHDDLKDIKIIECIKEVLHEQQFVQCPNRILNNRYEELKTDLIAYDASIYECLFSDFYLLYDDAESKIIFV